MSEKPETPEGWEAVPIDYTQFDPLEREILKVLSDGRPTGITSLAMYVERPPSEVRRALLRLAEFGLVKEAQFRWRITQAGKKQKGEKDEN